MSEFQPKEDEFGATYTLDSADNKLEEVAVTKGMTKGERMFYTIDLSDMDFAPDFLNISCNEFEDESSASEWMDVKQSFLGNYLVSPENEAPLETAGDHAFTITGIVPDGKRPPMYNGFVLFRVGVHTCEYSSWDFNGDYLQFVIDMVNRVIDRVQEPLAADNSGLSEPTQSAGDFIIADMSRLREGLWEERWQSLHPAQQALVPLDVYLFCMGSEKFPIGDVEIISEEPGIPDNFPEVGEVTTTRVTYRVTVEGVSDVFESHLLNMDGAWRWSMKDSILNAFKQGQCS